MNRNFKKTKKSTVRENRTRQERNGKEAATHKNCRMKRKDKIKFQKKIELKQTKVKHLISSRIQVYENKATKNL